MRLGGQRCWPNTARTSPPPVERLLVNAKRAVDTPVYSIADDPRHDRSRVAALAIHMRLLTACKARGQRWMTAATRGTVVLDAGREGTYTQSLRGQGAPVPRHVRGTNHASAREGFS